MSCWLNWNTWSWCWNTWCGCRVVSRATMYKSSAINWKYMLRGMLRMQRMLRLTTAPIKYTALHSSLDTPLGINICREKWHKVIRWEREEGLKAVKGGQEVISHDWQTVTQLAPSLLWYTDEPWERQPVQCMTQKKRKQKKLREEEKGKAQQGRLL